MRLILTAVLFSLMAFGAAAQSQLGPVKQVRPPCGAGFVQNGPSHWPGHQNFGYIKASVPAPSAGQLRIDFVGHSSFLITSPGGVRVVTDYNDFFRADVLPHIATMSGWHHNHTTTNIQPEIVHALHGWDNDGRGTPRHDVNIDDLRVYSVAANLGDGGVFFRYPTSVFVIESHGICIAHLGLIGQAIDQALANRIGQVDIVMTPVDRRVTQSMEELLQGIRMLKPKLVIPMHYNSEFTVESFLATAGEHFPVRRTGTGAFIAEKAKLPASTEILYLKPPFFSSGF